MYTSNIISCTYIQQINFIVYHYKKKNTDTPYILINWFIEKCTCVSTHIKIVAF